MTKDDIFRMARKSGGADISSNGWTSWVGTQSTEFLERFANSVYALAAEREREACAKWLDFYDGPNCRRAEAIRARGNT